MTASSSTLSDPTALTTVKLQDTFDYGAVQPGDVVLVRTETADWYLTRVSAGKEGLYADDNWVIGSTLQMTGHHRHPTFVPPQEAWIPRHFRRNASIDLSLGFGLVTRNVREVYLNGVRVL